MASPQAGVRPSQPSSSGDGDPVEGWSRFDIAGFATLYGGVNALTAYEESLASARVDPEEYEGLFDDEDVEPVSEQWAQLGHMNEQNVPAQWRTVRSLSSFVPKRAVMQTPCRAAGLGYGTGLGVASGVLGPAVRYASARRTVSATVRHV